MQLGIFPSHNSYIGWIHYAFHFPHCYARIPLSSLLRSLSFNYYFYRRSGNRLLVQCRRRRCLFASVFILSISKVPFLELICTTCYFLSCVLFIERRLDKKKLSLKLLYWHGNNPKSPRFGKSAEFDGGHILNDHDGGRHEIGLPHRWGNPVWPVVG